jgi:soluble lytic murein transglycosylase
MRGIWILTPLLVALGLALGVPARAQQPAAEATALAPAAASAADDSVILDMHQAFRRGDKERLAALLPQAAGHVLEPWAAYWALKARLEDATEPEVQDFLSRWAGTYQEDRLRNDWLLLAGKRRDWAAFARELPRFRMGDDPEVRCYASAMQVLQGAPASAAMADQVRRDWLAERREGDGCLLAAGLLRQAGRITADDVWQKARLAVEAGRSGLARAAVALESPDAAVAVAQIHNGAARYLAGRSASAATRQGQELVVLALVRLATQDADQAASLLQARWAKALTPAQRNWLWAALGKQAMLKLQDDAWADFAQVTRVQDLGDDLLSWQARAALRAGQWRGVRAAIEAMGEPLRREPTWVYWHARAGLALAPEGAAGDAARADARQALQGIANGRGFYEQLALEAWASPCSARPSRRRSPPTSAPPPRQPRAAARPAGDCRGPARRGRARVELLDQPAPPWRHGRPRALRRRRPGLPGPVWDRCINTSERTRAFDIEQRFPPRTAPRCCARRRPSGSTRPTSTA